LGRLSTQQPIKRTTPFARDSVRTNDRGGVLERHGRGRSERGEDTK
jgi:hypothetical protein